MITPDQNKIFERWDELPPSLKDALFSEAASDFLWKTCSDEHIPEEKIHVIARLVGYVLEGFLHPEDMANEIRDELGIDLRIAAAIASAINQRIFTPIRADIDKVYQPIEAPEEKPKIVQEIRPAPVVPARKPATPGGAVPPPMSIPLAPTRPTPKPAVPTPTGSPIGTVSKGITSPSAPVPAPKPLLFQTEAVPRPIQNAPDFRIPKVAENIMDEGAARVLPVRSAIVEIGGIPKPATPTQTPKPPMPGMPRYGGEKIEPPKPEPTRTVMEITSETFQKTNIPVPKAEPAPFTPILQTQVPSSIRPPIAPKPPVPPIPNQKPAQNPETKVVQKDYSESEK